MPPDAPALTARRALAPRYWAGHMVVLAAVVVCAWLTVCADGHWISAHWAPDWE